MLDKMLPVLIVMYLVTTNCVQGLFFKNRALGGQRNVVYYLCLNFEAVDSTQASECLYCPQRQTVACTGITGPPLQVTIVQANCLRTYCNAASIGGLSPLSVAARSRARRSLPPKVLEVDTTIRMDNTLDD